MLDAARNGDVKKYLGAYSGAMAASLRQSIAESSDAAFRQYLQDTNRALKGVAGLGAETINDPRGEGGEGDVDHERHERPKKYRGKNRSRRELTHRRSARR